MKPLNQVAARFGESVFTTLTEMANQAGAINLAQGFPDFDGPDWIKELACKAITSGRHQYAPSLGAPALRQALSHLYQEQYRLDFDPQRHILITVGASEAIYCAIAALVNPGDEVLCFEPLYDSYVASARMAGAKVVPVLLPFPALQLDLAVLEAAVTPQTKLLLLNSPHNPTGKVFSQQELELLAEFALRHDLYVICDEVYEYLTYDVPHLPLASLPGLRDRVITISSMGKTLGMTGWKIGWALGPTALIAQLHRVHQFITFCLAHPLQLALAEALPRLPGYLPELRTSYRQKRDFLVTGLQKLGYQVQNPPGTYFALAQLPPGREDLETCKELIQRNKVAVIPLSSFYLASEQGKSLIRFCFAKRQETLTQALANLAP